jgi:hypothetical protein
VRCRILADRVAGAHRVAQRLLLGTRDTDRVKLAGQQQPHQLLGIAPIGVHPVPAAREILLGAGTTHATPRRTSSRASA